MSQAISESDTPNLNANTFPVTYGKYSEFVTKSGVSRSTNKIIMIEMLHGLCFVIGVVFLAYSIKDYK
jgi:hypothetical protein